MNVTMSIEEYRPTDLQYNIFWSLGTRGFRMENLKWSKWLDELKTWPAEAPEWEHADIFVKSILGIAEMKRQEQASYQAWRKYSQIC
jgi:hypothetical protein